MPSPAEALAQAWRRLNYPASPAAPAWLARCVDLPAEAPLEEVAAALLEPARLRALSQNPEVAAALDCLAQQSGPARASSLLRQGVLDGLGDLELGLAELLEAGLLLVRPPAGRRAWSPEEELARRGFLRRELWLPQPVLEHWQQQAPFTAARTPILVEAPVVSPGAHSTRALEVDLLTLTCALDLDPLLLNKNGTPNLRSLGRAVSSLSLGEAGEAGPDLRDPEVMERALFLLALGLSLGALRVQGASVVASPQMGASFFEAPRGQRDRELRKAWRGLAQWHEPGAWLLLRHDDAGLTARGVLDAEGPGARLGGPRGQVLEDLARLPLDQWCYAQVVMDRLLELDRGYLASALASALTGPEAQPRVFVEAALHTALRWLGFVELGRDPQGRAALRWTPRGAHAVGVGQDTQPAQRPPGPPPLIVQPNLEVTVFLQDASLSTLFLLSQLGRRGRLTEHTAVYALDAAHVQRSYGRGLEAAQVVAFLREKGRTPLPDSVVFTLEDWQRVHRKVTLHASGALLEGLDPDALDVLLGGLDLVEEQDQPLRLGPSEVFLPAAAWERAARQPRAQTQQRFDYGPAPGLAGSPCLCHLEAVRFEALPGGLDLITAAELEHMAELVEPGLWELRAEKIRAHLGPRAEEALLSFLSPRLEDPPDAALRLRLRALVSQALHASVRPRVVLELSSAEVADLLLEVHEVEEHVQERLGPCALALDPEAAPAVEAFLRDLGLSRQQQE